MTIDRRLPSTVQGWLGVFLSAVLLAGTLTAADSNGDCRACHEDNTLKSAEGRALFVDPAKFGASVHGQAGLECIDCHADLKDVKDFPHPEKLKPADCAACHEGPARELETSSHGRGRKGDAAAVPTCVDCHGAHDIIPPQDVHSAVYATKVAAVCAKCHDDDVLSRQYGFLTSRLRTYRSSFHGVASKFGETRVANCASCHGHHNILPAADPRSPTNPANLAGTCGKCHSGAGANFVRGKIHIVSEKDSSPASRIIRIFYILLIVGVVAFSLLFIAADLWSRLRPR